jgi:hypothetical protein
MRARAFTLPLPRHPLLRMLVLVGGAILLAGLVAMSLIVGTAVWAVGATWLLVRRWIGRRKRPADPAVIEGEFTVVQRNSLPRTD